MSLVDKKNIKCPKCNKDIEVSIHRSINVSLDKEMVDNVRNFSAFTKVCEHCGTRLPLEYNCMYHDMDKRYIVYSLASINDMYQAFDSMDMFVAQGYKIRFVESNRDLVEKVNMFHTGYKDTVIEFIKLQVCAQLDEDTLTQMGDSENIRFIDYDDTKNALRFILILGGRMQDIFVPIAEYEKLSKIIPADIYDRRDMKSTRVKGVSVAEWLKAQNNA